MGTMPLLEDISQGSSRSRKSKTTTFSIAEDPDSSVIRGGTKSQSMGASGRSLETVKVGKVNSGIKRKLLEQNSEGWIIFPWNRRYRYWWALTVFCAVLTVFTETYAVAFVPSSSYLSGDALSVIEYVLVSIFVIDIVVHFHLVYYDVDDNLIMDKREIAIHYLKRFFWVDLAGIFPLYLVALAIVGDLGGDSNAAPFLSLLRLVKLVRLHRVAQLFAELQYNPRVSLIWLTLIRNFGFAILWSHFSACIFFFIAREYDFNPDKSWIGGSIDSMSSSEKYVTSLYYSIVTFAGFNQANTNVSEASNANVLPCLGEPLVHNVANNRLTVSVGYGDWSAVNSAEQVWCIVYMLLNMVVHAWIIGSITLLIVKQDEKTGAYRESIQVLRLYTKLHSLPREFEKKLRGQLQLDFNNAEVSDEFVLGHFPAETRRKVLRRLYLPALLNANLMRGIRQQFVDAFLTTCKVELFSAGEELLQRGNIATDLYLLVAGSVELLSSAQVSIEQYGAQVGSSQYGGTSIGEDRSGGDNVEVNSGEFINAVSFFTESSQLETVKTKTVCKTLTMSREIYKSLAEDHPGSIGKLFQNLLEDTVAKALKAQGSDMVGLPEDKLSLLRAGSVYQFLPSDNDDFRKTQRAAEAEASLSAVRDLVKMHMNKMKDDHTTRFLFAASRGDVDTINLMCNQGFDPDSADYDRRTAVMVAAMKGNAEAVEALLTFGANPNLVDMHGTSALYEAAKNGHDAAIDCLLRHGATLNMSSADAASRACQFVFDGDMLTLRRLLKAGLPVDAGDYDMRRPLHIAAAEGSTAAVKLLVEFGADVTVTDRWGKTAADEAESVGASHVVDYLLNIMNTPSDLKESE